MLLQIKVVTINIYRLLQYRANQLINRLALATNLFDTCSYCILQ